SGAGAVLGLEAGAAHLPSGPAAVSRVPELLPRPVDVTQCSLVGAGKVPGHPGDSGGCFAGVPVDPFGGVFVCGPEPAQFEVPGQPRGGLLPGCFLGLPGIQRGRVGGQSPVVGEPGSPDVGGECPLLRRGGVQGVTVRLGDQFVLDGHGVHLPERGLGCRTGYTSPGVFWLGYWVICCRMVSVASGVIHRVSPMVRPEALVRGWRPVMTASAPSRSTIWDRWVWIAWGASSRESKWSSTSSRKPYRPGVVSIGVFMGSFPGGGFHPSSDPYCTTRLGERRMSRRGTSKAFRRVQSGASGRRPIPAVSMCSSAHRKHQAWPNTDNTTPTHTMPVYR